MVEVSRRVILGASHMRWLQFFQGEWLQDLQKQGGGTRQGMLEKISCLKGSSGISCFSSCDLREVNRHQASAKCSVFICTYAKRSVFALILYDTKRYPELNYLNYSNAGKESWPIRSSISIYFEPNYMVNLPTVALRFICSPHGRLQGNAHSLWRVCTLPTFKSNLERLPYVLHPTDVGLNVFRSWKSLCP